MSWTTLVFITFYVEINLGLKFWFELVVFQNFKFEKVQILSNDKMTKIKVVDLHDPYDFDVYQIFIWDHLVSQNYFSSFDFKGMPHEETKELLLASLLEIFRTLWVELFNTLLVHSCVAKLFYSYEVVVAGSAARRADLTRRRESGVAATRSTTWHPDSTLWQVRNIFSHLARNCELFR